MTPEAWVFGYQGFDPDQEGLREALLAVGNGHFVTRGAAPECRADGVHYPGTYRAGCYDRLATTIGGETVENESLVNLPNWLPLTFRIEGGRWFDPGETILREYGQELDMKEGVLHRKISFRDPRGRECRLRERRFVSMVDPHLAAIETALVAVNWSGRVEIRAGLDARVENAGVERYRALEGRHLRPVRTVDASDGTVALEADSTSSRRSPSTRSRRTWGYRHGAGTVRLAGVTSSGTSSSSSPS